MRPEESLDPRRTRRRRTIDEKRTSFPKPPKQNFLLMKALLFKEEEEDKEDAFVVKVVAWRISFCAKVFSFFGGVGKHKKNV